MNIDNMSLLDELKAALTRAEIQEMEKRIHEERLSREPQPIRDMHEGKITMNQCRVAMGFDPIGDIKGGMKNLSWHKLPDTENMLQDHYFYLVRHIEFSTPMKAKFHADGEPHFEIYGCNHGAGKMIVYEHEFGNHITHWMDMPDLPAESEG